jgi:chromosome segregation ATPase
MKLFKQILEEYMKEILFERKLQKRPNYIKKLKESKNNQEPIISFGESLFKFGNALKNLLIERIEPENNYELYLQESFTVENISDLQKYTVELNEILEYIDNEMVELLYDTSNLKKIEQELDGYSEAAEYHNNEIKKIREQPIEGISSPENTKAIFLKKVKFWDKNLLEFANFIKEINTKYHTSIRIPKIN